MPIHTTEELLAWIRERNRDIHVDIRKTDLARCAPWHYDEARGEIRNGDGSFFQIKGIRVTEADGTVTEQPVIIQDEIGYLGIICKRFGGEMHYLMQAKIEPGNINKIQLSPTIQATKSNFTQKHGGRKPAYLDYFVNAKAYRIIADQIQSEQSSRFYKKRNRNIVIEAAGDVEALPSHRWMTMGQIKALMRQDNLVNMDTRTVLSCLPLEEYLDEIGDETLKKSVLGTGTSLPRIYQDLNNYKMFSERKTELVPLTALKDWEMQDGEFVCKRPYSFRLIFRDIEIEGREVRHWSQPLFEAAGIALFGLITRVREGAREFLVRMKPEIGCFDGVELGPSVQREFVHAEENTAVDALLDAHMKTGAGVLFDTLLSEEGGRFYHEQNRNVVIEITPEELDTPPEGYFWTDYKTLGTLVKVNNCLNIQLRNLLSVLEW